MNEQKPKQRGRTFVFIHNSAAGSPEIVYKGLLQEDFG